MAEEKKPVQPPPPDREKQQQQQERERQERERQRKTTQEQEGAEPLEDELKKIGSPMRDDDKMNYFRAPDLKPQGAIFGEDATQPARPKFPERVQEPPPETHAQTPGPEAEPEEEEKNVATARKG